jgi:S1-C subfamily serine protease
MSAADWVAVAIVVLAGLYGYANGALRGALSLAGFALGAYLGATLAPELLRDEWSPYAPLIALGGAVLCGFLFQSLAGILGSALRSGVSAVPGLGVLDRLAGLALGILAGFALVWAIGAVLLYVPGQSELRRNVQGSEILSRLNDEFPPERLIETLQRVDPLGALVGPAVAVPPGKPGIVKDPDVVAATQSVVRVTGIACGLGVEGTGWIAAPGVVVTAAHVVAGVGSPRVDRGEGRSRRARIVAFDVDNDLAVLRVAGLDGTPLQVAEPAHGVEVALAGFPGNEALSTVPGRLGDTGKIVLANAYGIRKTFRVVTTIRANVRAGNSGSPAIDAAGRVRTTVFARRVDDVGGYGIPTAVVRGAVKNAGEKALRRTPCVGP